MSRQAPQSSVDAQIGHIWVLLGYVAFAIAWLVLVFLGVGLVIAGRGQVPLGWAVLTAAAAAAFATAHKWVRVLPGIFGVGTINCLFAFGNGYFGTSPGLRISRPAAGEMALLMVGCAVLSSRLQSAPVTLFERAALCAVVVFVSAAFADARFGMWGFSLAFACLGAAVGKRYLDRRKRPAHPK